MHNFVEYSLWKQWILVDAVTAVLLIILLFDIIVSLISILEAWFIIEAKLGIQSTVHMTSKGTLYAASATAIRSTIRCCNKNVSFHKWLARISFCCQIIRCLVGVGTFHYHWSHKSFFDEFTHTFLLNMSFWVVMWIWGFHLLSNIFLLNIHEILAVHKTIFERALLSYYIRLSLFKR